MCFIWHPKLELNAVEAKRSILFILVEADNPAKGPWLALLARKVKGETCAATPCLLRCFRVQLQAWPFPRLMRSWSRGPGILALPVSRPQPHGPGQFNSQMVPIPTGNHQQMPQKDGACLVWWWLNCFPELSISPSPDPSHRKPDLPSMY